MPLQDNFDDNKKAAWWLDFINGAATVAETNQRLECTCPTGGPTAENAGYVTAGRYDLSGRYVEIEIASLSHLWTMNLGISPILDPSKKFFEIAEWYRIRKNRETEKCEVSRRLVGQSLEHKYQGAWAGATGVIKIELKDDGNIYFYENGVLKYSEPYALSSTEVYIYIFGSDISGYTGTDALDNFNSSIPVVTYTLNITATSGGTTDPAPGSYTYVEDTVVSVTAIPNTTYDFDHWELDGVNVGATNPINVTMSKNRSLYAVFTPILHKLTVISTPVSGVSFTLNGSKVSTPFSRNTPEGSYTIVMPSSVTVGTDVYSFTQWENGSTNPSRTVSLTRDLTLTASFTKTAIIDPLTGIQTPLVEVIEGTGPINQRQMKDVLKEVLGGGSDLSQENPLPTQLEPGTSILSGAKTVDAPGTPVAIGSGTCISVTVKAFAENAITGRDANTGMIYVGNSKIQRFELAAGESVSIDVDDVSKVYIDADVAGEGVSWIALDKTR